MLSSRRPRRLTLPMKRPRQLQVKRPARKNRAFPGCFHRLALAGSAARLPHTYIRMADLRWRCEDRAFSARSTPVVPCRVRGETSMNPCRVALAQIAPRLGELDANLALHLEAIQRARRQGAGLVVFPELSLTGYLLRDDVPEVALRIEDPRLARLLRASRDIDVVLGLVEESPGHRFYNAAAYLSGGRVLHVHRKVYLPTYGMFD